jgi:hypothetical protein
MLLTEYLMTKAAEEASELACAFSQAAVFGLDAINEKYGHTYRAGIGEEVNDSMVFVRLMREEGLGIVGIGDTTDIEGHRVKIGQEIFKVLGAEPTPEALAHTLLILGAIKANLLTKAFTKALTFGIDSVDPVSGLSARTKIACLINCMSVVINMLTTEGVEIPGIGDESYINMRYEKAVGQVVEQHAKGIISNIRTTIESESPNGGVIQDDPTIVGATEPGVGSENSSTDSESGTNVDELECVKAITYDPATGGDAAANQIVNIDQ